MSRRYLTINEAESRLQRGKEVKCFLGGFNEGGIDAIRWLVFRYAGSGFQCELWENIDQSSANYADVYSFEGLGGEYDSLRRKMT